MCLSRCLVGMPGAGTLGVPGRGIRRLVDALYVYRYPGIDFPEKKT